VPCARSDLASARVVLVPGTATIGHRTGSVFWAQGRRTKAHWLDYSPQWRLKSIDAVGSGLIELCARADTVELWIDPRPDGQVELICLLHYLRVYPEIAAKLSLVQAHVRLGSQSPEVLAKWQLPVVKISDGHFELASRAWRALGAATLEDWFDLLATDLSLLPRLRNAVIQLLEELPWRATGLGATEMRMLEFISETKPTPRDVFGGEHGESRRISSRSRRSAMPSSPMLTTSPGTISSAAGGAGPN
jgi:hypothetical protein